MLKRLALLAGLLALLATPRPAFAVLGMCTLTGTVYNVDGSVAKFGTVNFRLPTTQTFSADSVQTSLEHVVLDSGGNLPAGTQVPLGARIFIQVGNDKPVSVVVTNNPANCPLAFGTLVGSVAGGVPIPSTVVTSITTVNNIPGITDTAVNPPGAGPATLTLSDGYPITFGQSSVAAELSGASFSPYSTFFSGNSNGVSLQFSNNLTGTHNDGQIVWGGTNSPDTDKRDVVLQAITPGNGTHSSGHFQLFVADTSGTGLATLGPTLDVLPNVQKFNYNANTNETVVAANPNAGNATQAYFDAQSNAGDLFSGIRGSGYALGDVPASFGFVEAGGLSTKGLYLVSDAGTGDQGIHFASSNQIGAGNLKLTEDSSGNFFWTTSVAAAQNQFIGGNPTLTAVSTTNSTADVVSVFPQNLTQEVGIWYGGIREEGSNGNNAIAIDPQGTGEVALNANVGGSGTWAFSSLGTVNNHHLFSSQNNGTLPSTSGACGTGATIRAGSTDVAGQLFWTSNVSQTNCLINFGASWAATPECVCSAVGSVGGVATACGTNASTTQLQLNFQIGATANSGQVNWICIGLTNGASG